MLHLIEKYLLDDTLPVIRGLKAHFFLADLLAGLVVMAAFLTLRSMNENVAINCDSWRQAPIKLIN